jgi:hypothetical protein
MTLLGTTGELKWKQVGGDVEVELPGSLPGKYAYGMKVVGVE